MGTTFLFLAMAGAAVAGDGDAQIPTYQTFCRLKDASANVGNLLEHCQELTELLQRAQRDVATLKNASDKALVDCHSKADGAALKQLEAKLDILVADDSAVLTDPEPSCDTTSIDQLSADELKKLTTPEATYLKAYRAWDQAQSTLKSQTDRFVEWHDVKTGVFAQATSVPGYAPSPRSSGQPQIAGLKDCNLTVDVRDTELLQDPNGCARLAHAHGDPTLRIDQLDKPSRPPRTKLLPSIEISDKSGSGQVLLSTTYNRYRGFGDSGRQTRTPSTWGWTAGFEAQTKDGLATIIDNKVANGDFFDRERLNTTLAAKGSIGWNYYPQQTLQQFERDRRMLVQAMTGACLKSLGDGTTKIATNCSDAMLLAWVYERAGGKYVRMDQVEAYEKLIWRPTAKYPVRGFGFTFRAGFPSASFFDFSDADGVFQPSWVDTADFFTKDPTLRTGKVGPKLASEFGGYLYRHWPDLLGLQGLTARLDLGRRHDLEDLTDKKINICRTDLPGAGASVVNETARCKEVLAFEPEFETSTTGKLSSRLLFREVDGIGALGIAPSIFAKWIPDKKDTYTFDVPVFFADQDTGLRTGLMLRHEVDYAKVADKAATSLFFFISTEFSLDGSKD